ncbi:hypothetical protein CRV24_003302 [Beauveria bassiana]|nr:hypothetical protein CRV24_003302 [Beauveria bassiana]KAH8718714.1 hypothetical protein HC256_003341 [Beauveria bassiana]
MIAGLIPTVFLVYKLLPSFVIVVPRSTFELLRLSFSDVQLSQTQGEARDSTAAQVIRYVSWQSSIKQQICNSKSQVLCHLASNGHSLSAFSTVKPSLSDSSSLAVSIHWSYTARCASFAASH